MNTPNTSSEFTDQSNLEESNNDTEHESCIPLDSIAENMPAISKAAKEVDPNGGVFYRVPGRVLGIKIHP